MSLVQKERNAILDKYAVSPEDIEKEKATLNDTAAADKKKADEEAEKKKAEEEAKVDKEGKKPDASKAPELSEEEKKKKTEEAAAAADAEKNKKPDTEITEGSVLKFLSEQRGKNFESLDDVFKVEEKVVEKEVEIDNEDVASLLKYTRETGRGVEDWMKFQKDWKDADGDTVVREYLRVQNPSLDSDDIEHLIKRKYDLDPELNDETEIKDAQIDKKILVDKGRKFFEGEKAKYNVPIEKKTPVVEGDSVKEQVTKARKAWFTQADKATNDQVNIEAEGFAYKTQEKEALLDKYDSLEKVLSRYKSEDGSINLKKLIKVMETGENFESIASGIASTVKTKTLEEFMKDKKNHAGGRQTKDDGTVSKMDEKTRAYLDRLGR